MLTITRQKQKKRKKKDETEKGQMQIQGFLSQTRMKIKQPTVSRQRFNPFVHDEWNKKKEHRTSDQKEDK